MGGPFDKRPKPAAKVGPKPVIITTATPVDGHDPEFDRLFWSNFTQAPIEKVGPPAGNATLGSPYVHGPLPALAPEQQFDWLVHQMGFDNSSPGAPAIDPKGTGAGVGPAKAQGYKVYAAIQIVDPKGNQVYVGYGAYTGGGGPHGEEKAIANLKANLPKNVDLKGGRLITTVTQCPCGSDRHDCASQIESFAKANGLIAETYVPERDAVNPNVKTPVSPSTASRGAMRTDRPVIRLKNVAPPSTAITPAEGEEEAVLAQRAMNRQGGGELTVDLQSPTGVAKMDAILVSFYAINFIANTVNDHIQRKHLNEALDAEARIMRKHLAEHPDEGALVIVFCSQFVPAVPGIMEMSILQPGARFESLDHEFGKTMAEAKAKWLSVARIQGVPEGYRLITQYLWLPPPNEW